MPANGNDQPHPLQTGPLTQRLPGARATLILLLAINLFNFIDRQLLSAVEPEIRKELLQDGQDEKDIGPELRATANFKMGLLSMAFLVTFMFTAPLFGWLADRMSRWGIVGIGVILWSLASGASGIEWGVGLAVAFWLLFITRLLVGVGEGAYGPVAPTMLSDLYPVKDRGWVIAWFYLAAPVGGALGYALGAVVVKNIGWSWHWAFYLVVPPGLLLGIICFAMRDPPRGRADDVAISSEVKVSGRDALQLLKIPSYLLNTFGMTAMMFAIGALAFWMPAYLEEVDAPDLFGVDPRFVFGIITATAGLIATLLGGIVGDQLRERIPGSYLVVSGTAMILGFPMMLLFLWAPFPWAWIFGFLAVFCLFFNTGPSNTALANVTHPALRATGFAMNILVIHLLGDAISPPLIGVIAGWTSRAFGFVVVSIFMVVGGIFWLWGARYLGRDTELAPTRLRQ